MITPQFLNPISKLFCKFLLQFNMAKRTHVFSALGRETQEKELAEKKIRFDL